MDHLNYALRYILGVRYEGIFLAERHLARDPSGGRHRGGHHLRVQNTYIPTRDLNSVADPGSGAFFVPGIRDGKKSGCGMNIPDHFSWMRIRDPESF
jgi:hypothetical protein